MMNNKEIIQKLQYTETSIVIETLKYISKEGNKEILNHVIKLLHDTKNILIRDEIIKILDYLKEQNCVISIIDAIKNPIYENELPILISACWKNGLNYEDYIEIFTDIFIQSDFQLAFEALTVIDNFVKIDPKKADVCLIKLENSIENANEDKKPLFYELIGIIEHIKENPAE